MFEKKNVKTKKSIDGSNTFENFRTCDNVAFWQIDTVIESNVSYRLIIYNGQDFEKLLILCNRSFHFLSDEDMDDSDDDSSGSGEDDDSDEDEDNEYMDYDSNDIEMFNFSDDAHV